MNGFLQRVSQFSWSARVSPNFHTVRMPILLAAMCVMAKSIELHKLVALALLKRVVSYCKQVRGIALILRYR